MNDDLAVGFLFGLMVGMASTLTALYLIAH